MTKEITIEEYEKKADRIIKKKLSIGKTFIKLLEMASKYKIKGE